MKIMLYDETPERSLFLRMTLERLGHDIVAVIDSSDLAYAGVAEHVKRIPGQPRLVSVDHHVTNDGFGHVNAVDRTASSACEVMHRLFRECGEGISPAVATCLLTGIVTDTNGFNNNSTTSSAFKSASELLRAGARFQEPFRQVLRNRPIPSLKLWGQAMSRLKFDERHGVASVSLFLDDFKDGADEENVDGIANFLAMYLDAPVILVLKEVAGGKVKGSMRSVGRRDVAALAARLGGGGHKEAAGFLLPGRITEAAHGWTVAG